MQKSIVALAAAFLAFVSPQLAAQVLEVSGSTTVQKRVIEPNVAAIKAATGVEVKIYGVGSGKGMIALAEKKTTVAAVSETLEEAIASGQKGAKAEGKEFSVPANLRFHELADDTMVIVVHHDNPLSAITKEQAKDLNTGKIKNWKELGGPDLPVRVVTGAPNSATRAVFQSKVMDGLDYAPGALEMRTTAEEAKSVGLAKGAIGVVSESFAKSAPDKVKVLSGVRVRRPLALITIGAPSADAQKVIAFLRSKEGKKLITAQ